MKLYIELLIVIFLAIMFLLWKLWFKISERRLLKQYKPENDKGRKGTIEQGEGIGEPIISSNGLEEPGGQQFLPKAEVDNVGKNNTRNRKLRKIFGRK